MAMKIKVREAGVKFKVWYKWFGQKGYELNGRIKCFAAGTKEAPFDRYDMTVEIY